jgi:flagellar biogenesis protein FliO
MDVLGGEGFRQVMGVLVVFALLAVTVWKLRSGPLAFPRGTRAESRLQAAGRINLTPQHAIHVIRVDGRELLVATHPQGCAVLSDLHPNHLGETRA